MLFADIRSNFEQRFNTNWTSTTVIAWENSDLVVPSDYWVRFTVLPFETENAALGTRTNKKGLIILQVYGPKGKGTGKLYELADDFNTLMENYRFPGLDLFTYAGALEVIGESPTTSFNPGGSGQFRELTAGFFQINIKIPFEAL